MGEKVVSLLSGGIDSTTLLAWLAAQDYEVYPVSIKYPSRHNNIELISAQKIVEYYRVDPRHKIIEIPKGVFSNSALIDKELPLGRTLEEMEASGMAPSFVPARNTVFLSLAAAVADSMDARYVAFAAHAEDHVGYADCRPEFFACMNAVLVAGTKNKIELLDPFIRWHKSDIVKEAKNLRVPAQFTHSCYQGVSPACGTCDTCTVRIEAFKTAKLIDPVKYAVEIDWKGCKTW